MEIQQTMLVNKNMKKHTLLFFALLLVPFLAFARGNHHHRQQQTPPPVSQPPVTKPPAPTPPPPSKIPTSTISNLSTLQVGAFTGGGDSSIAQNIEAIFWGWDSFDGLSGNPSKTLLIYWEPTVNYAAISNGSQDAYLNQAASQLKAYGHPILLVPMDEFNLNETPWGNTVGGNTPAGFIAAWQHIVTIFRNEGATNVKFGLAYNNVSIPNVPFASFYPGSNYVDYVGIDAFNYGNASFAQSVASLSQLTGYGRPIYLFSVGAQGSQQGQWITDMVNAVPHLNLAGVIYFDYQSFAMSASSLVEFQSL